MSKQIQFRRGTSTEHENFTGAIGEITVDTTNKTLRVHDGQTLGGTILAKQSEIPDIANADYVVESQLPTAANNYTWYRKYKSGWVEIGGKIETANNQNNWVTNTITIPLEMADTNYQIMISNCNLSNGAFGSGSYAEATSVTTFKFFQYNVNAGNPCPIIWEIKGVAA